LCPIAVASQEAVEALARAGLRNPVKVAVAVTAAAADGSSKKRQRQQDGQQQEGSAAAGAMLEQKTPTSLSLEYIMCSVDEKLPQLVSTCYRTCYMLFASMLFASIFLHIEGAAAAAAAAAAGAASVQKTPTSLSLEYILCSVDEKLPQLVSTCYITCYVALLCKCLLLCKCAYYCVNVFAYYCVNVFALSMQVAFWMRFAIRN
jgi:hypothetical protein